MEGKRDWHAAFALEGDPLAFGWFKEAMELTSILNLSDEKIASILQPLIWEPNFKVGSRAIIRLGSGSLIRGHHAYGTKQ